MNDTMNSITPLDPCRKKKFLRPAGRLIDARIRLHSFYHEHPIQSDFIPEAEAIAAWSIVSCSYSGIEQAMKCLLKMQDIYVDKDLSDGGHRHHYIGKLFKDLASEEQNVLRAYYAVYRSLHDYIPSKTVDCFLYSIDDGYPTWRYFLLEGSEEDGWPTTTHPGAMLEIWSALTDILQARVFTNHGLYTVKQRLDFHLRKLHINAVHQAGYQANLEQINNIIHWQQSNNFVDINFYTDLFYCYENGRNEAQPSTLPKELTALPVLRALVDIVETDKANNDFSHFLYRAKTSRIVWNPHQDRFETVSH